MNKYIIWGAGNYGKQAYWYYKYRGEILFYVDSNFNKFPDGLKINSNSIPVYSPETLTANKDCTIIIAVKNYDLIYQCVLNMGIEAILIYDPQMENVRNSGIMNELNEVRSINLGKFLQSCGNLSITCVGYSGNSGILDYAFLRGVAKKYNISKYLEIGTYIGESLKAVSDLCDECYSVTAPFDAPYHMRGWCKNRNLPDYSDRLANDNNVIHYYCDSKMLDWSKIPNDIDLYFIDGDHTYNGVYIDTKNVFVHRKPNSIVIWHDFKNANSWDMNSGVAVAVKDAIGDEFENVFCVDNNMCGIYLPKSIQNDFEMKPCSYTDAPQDMFFYECDIKVRLDTVR